MRALSSTNIWPRAHTVHTQLPGPESQVPSALHPGPAAAGRDAFGLPGRWGLLPRFDVLCRDFSGCWHFAAQAWAASSHMAHSAGYHLQHDVPPPPDVPPAPVVLPTHMHAGYDSLELPGAPPIELPDSKQNLAQPDSTPSGSTVEGNAMMHAELPAPPAIQMHGQAKGSTPSPAYPQDLVAHQAPGAAHVAVVPQPQLNGQHLPHPAQQQQQLQPQQDAGFAMLPLPPAAVGPAEQASATAPRVPPAGGPAVQSLVAEAAAQQASLSAAADTADALPVASPAPSNIQPAAAAGAGVAAGQAPQPTHPAAPVSNTAPRSRVFTQWFEGRQGSGKLNSGSEAAADGAKGLLAATPALGAPAAAAAAARLVPGAPVPSPQQHHSVSRDEGDEEEDMLLSAGENGFDMDRPSLMIYPRTEDGGDQDGLDGEIPI